MPANSLCSRKYGIFQTLSRHTISSGKTKVNSDACFFCAQEINGYCLELMKKLGISEVAENDITEVSGGQLQRACICRSLINQPKILFADEPTGALNRSSSEDVMQELKKLNEEGTTIMLVTHDMKVAAKCSRILYIVDGNIKGELRMEEEGVEERLRERRLNQWLIEMGW